MDNSNDFFAWLATQPAFVEVAIGAFFCLVVAPALLAAVAVAVTAVDNFLEARLRPLASLLRANNAGHSVNLPAVMSSLRNIVVRAKPSPHANS